MKLVMKSFVALMLVLSLCLGNFSGIFAMAATKFENGNTWYGDEVKVDVTAGTDAYNYMVMFKKPVHGYEFAGHFIGEGEGAQTFVVIDTAAHDGTTWTPNGLYELGKSNYDVLYCCDVETMVKHGTYYKRVNLENSEYYTEAEADMIRAIVTNAYPYVSMEEMKAALAEAGFAYANELTRSEIISAVQAAIWASANEVTAEDLRYNKSYRVTDNYGWGQPMHDISDEAGYGVTGNRKFETYPEVGVRHDALVDYLLALEPVKANDNQIVITELDIVKSQIEGTEGQYDVNLNVELNYGADADDEVVLNVYVNDECVEEVKVNNEKNYSMNLKAMENDQIKVTVSGTQNLERGVYFYAPEPADVNGDGIATSREVSQNLVGVSMGATPVYAESVVKIHNGVLTADKTAEKVGDERFDVSIEVPGGDAEKIHDEIILMVDGSYSMDNEWPAMKEAIVAIGEAVLDGSGHTQLTLMAFGMGDNEVLVHVKTVAELFAALGELPGNLLYGRSSTNCEAGFTGVAEYIMNHDETLGNVEVIFISDGNINTDETPRAFDANWQTWTKFGALTVAQAAFEGALVNGKNLPAAFSVFGDRFAGMTNEQILNAVFVDKTVAITDAEYLAYAEQLWTDVYAYSGLTRGEAYPVSDAERAFVKYDKENGTYIQDLFYYTTYKSAYVTYNDRWTRTPAAALELAAMEQVKHLYVVDYDGKSAWMELGHEKSDFILSSGIAGLVEALQETLTVLSKTPFNDVVVTDYMSKWVILDPTTVRVVDGNGNLIAMFDEENSPKDADGNYTAYLYKWVGEALCANKAPIVLDLIPESEYAAGGADVIGNADGEIYRITWNLKDGPLMRNEAFALQYQVIINTEEPGFEYNKDYPANGNTFAEYKDEDGKDNKTDIKVPDIVTDRILTEVSGTKTWDDNNDQDGKRPESITVRLYANGVEVASMSVTEEMGWTYKFANLTKYANGVEIVYTITEDAVEGYTTVINGFDITNTYKPEETQITVNKVWNDANNQDGKRPGSITVTLLANGQMVTTQEITAEMGWTYTFENLPVYANGQKIIYTITEAAVEGYTTVINGFEITNTYKPEETQVVVNKVWDDDDDFEGKRPDEITIRLYANGVEILAQKVTANDNWTFTFMNLPVYANGQKIVYTITEDAVADYETLSIEGNAETGFTVTNQYLIEVPEEDPPLIDKTGDDIGMAMMAAMVSLMGAAVCVWNRKKENA